MKLKKEYIIIAVIIIGLSIYLIGRNTDRTLYELPDVPAVAQKDITKIEITKNKESIVLSQKDETWYIDPQGYGADTNKVNAMLDVLDDLTVTTLVSESKNYILYDLSADEKINVKAWQGETLKRDLDVGKAASSFRHTFVKLADDERVFHARDNFRDKFDQTRDDLRDKKVLGFKQDDIQEIQITSAQLSLTLAKTQAAAKQADADEAKTDGNKPPPPQAVWQTPDGKTGDVAALNQVLSSVSDLNCQEFIDDRKKESFTGAVLTLQLTDSQKHSLSIFPKFKEDEENYPATSSGSDYPFLLSASQVDRIMKSSEAIIPAAKESGAEEKAQKSESQK